MELLGFVWLWRRVNSLVTFGLARRRRQRRVPVAPVGGRQMMALLLPLLLSSLSIYLWLSSLQCRRRRRRAKAEPAQPDDGAINKLEQSSALRSFAFALQVIRYAS
jgi:hypothetical protein